MDPESNERYVWWVHNLWEYTYNETLRCVRCDENYCGQVAYFMIFKCCHVLMLSLFDPKRSLWFHFSSKNVTCFVVINTYHH